jgi:3-oxoacyl-[acyl-carrier protein] reductase
MPEDNTHIKMMKKKVLITGAASGIGKAAAIRFAAEGFDVALNDLNESNLEKLLHELPLGNHIIVPGSYADPATVTEAEKRIAAVWGRLDVLVSCAGIFQKSDALDDDITRWNELMLTMINGCRLVSILAAKFMVDGGRIIHITSIHGQVAEKYSSSYAVAKAAMNQYCRALAVELADRKILVNAIAPGFINTPMAVVEGVNENQSQWFIDNYVDSHHLPLKRPGEPEEVAGVAFFLAGKDASYITGQVITVDGGLTITF